MKRALFGLVLLMTWAAGGACLLHTSIEADGEPAGRSYSDEAGHGRVGTVHDAPPAFRVSRERSTREPALLGLWGGHSMKFEFPRNVSH